MKKFVLAYLVSLIWVLLAHSQYNYSFMTVSFWGMDFALYPLICWGAGLFLTYHIYEYFFSKKNLRHDFFRFVVFYSVLLILAETIAYWVFGVHNLAASSYSGLPICNCLHGVWWLKVAYFLLGPLYFLILKKALPIKQSL